MRRKLKKHEGKSKMAILAECPFCRNKQAAKTRFVNVALISTRQRDQKKLSTGSVTGYQSAKMKKAKQFINSVGRP